MVPTWRCSWVIVRVRPTDSGGTYLYNPVYILSSFWEASPGQCPWCVPSWCRRHQITAMGWDGENIQRMGEEGAWEDDGVAPLGFGIPCEPHQVATADARHRDLRSASQPQIGLSCHRFPVASIKTAMVRVLSFVLPCHGCWQIGVEGVYIGKRRWCNYWDDRLETWTKHEKTIRGCHGIWRKPQIFVQINLPFGTGKLRRCGPYSS